MTKQQPEGGRDELADLRAEVERLRLAVHDVLMACMDLEWATDGSERSMVNQVREVVRRWRADKAERDTALARLAEAEGVARTNAAWVQHWHAAAKEAREQVKAVRALCSPFADDAVKVVEEVAIRHSLPRAVAHAVVSITLRSVEAALDAVEPADQPHPTPEAAYICRHGEIDHGCDDDLDHKREAGS